MPFSLKTRIKSHFAQLPVYSSRHDIEFAQTAPSFLPGYRCDSRSNFAGNRASVSASAIRLCCFLSYFGNHDHTGTGFSEPGFEASKATIFCFSCVPASTARLATFLSQRLANTIAFANWQLRLLFTLASHLHAVSHVFVVAYNNNNTVSTCNVLAERWFGLPIRSNPRPSWRRSPRTRQRKCTGEHACRVCVCVWAHFHDCCRFLK